MNLHANACEQSDYALLDECTGSCLNSASPNNIGISLISDSKWQNTWSNETVHFIDSLEDENGISYVTSPISEPTVLPSYVDNTLPFFNSETNAYFTPFPPIASQGNLGSCIAFTAAYYQFTHEANLLNCIDSSTANNQYSAAFPYNYLFHPSQKIARAGIGDTGAVFDFLSERGCVKQTEFPYLLSYNVTQHQIDNEISIINNEIDTINSQLSNDEPAQPYITELTTVQLSALPKKLNVERWFQFNSLENASLAHSALRNALNTRVDSWYVYHVKNSGGEDGYIEGSSSDKLDGIKTLLARGKVLMGHMCIGWQDTVQYPGYTNPTYIRTAQGDTPLYKINNQEKVVCQIRSIDINGNSFGGHSVTIVGYDDNIWVDLNGDSVKQPGEQGAFKVINSWGQDNEMASFWVLYDALNPESTVSHNASWPAIANRTSFFNSYNYGEHYNRVFFMNVTNKNPLIIAQFSHYSNYRSLTTFSFSSSIRDVAGNNSTYQKNLVQRNNGRSPLLEVDYYDVSSIIGSAPLVGNATWTIYVNRNTVDINADENISWNFSPTLQNMQLNLIDNFGTELQQGTVYPGVFSINAIQTSTNIVEHDVNLSGEVAYSDYQLLYDYIYNNVRNLSNLQIYLADMNGDGKLTGYDCSAFYDWYMNE